ncbi:DUF389 domain-containing protein [Pirellulales bacterium]|nr:DUF389 domain-containing protein [Pirellulales bacterium]
MTVVLLLPPGFQPRPLLAWAMRIASARKMPLAVFDVKKSSQANVEQIAWQEGDAEATKRESELIQALRELQSRGELHDGERSTTADAGTGRGESFTDCQLIEIRHDDLESAILTELHRIQANLLVLPRHRGVKHSSSEFALQRHLFANARCAAMQLSLGQEEVAECRKIVVPTRGSRNTAAAIRLATDVAEHDGGSVTALFVQGDVDVAAEEVGKRTIKRLVRRYADDTEQRVATHSVLSDDVARGILDYAEQESDLVVIGASYHSVVHRLLFSSIAEEIICSDLRQAVAVIRPASPLGSRVVAACENVIGDVVPQLDRERRVELVARVQGSSRWDFDFIALICLSTLIAGLGLIQNSAAVVIGAMLVAPLMTPLLGAGLSLVQGNRMLAACSIGAVFRGFVLALAIGGLLGLAAGLDSATPEMLARCSPGVSDLLVAFASGLAAAYAVGRPNLVSALPGVAIAAALVPPIATSGLTLAQGRLDLSIGAGLLFLTNIVAIVLGAACSLWTVGIRSAHTHSFVSSWSARALASLAVIALGLGIYESTSQLKLPSALNTAIAERVESEAGTILNEVDLVRNEGRRQLHVVVDAPHPATGQLIADIANLAEADLSASVEIVVETRIVHRATHARNEEEAEDVTETETETETEDANDAPSQQR